jgi:TonB family protein
MGWMSNFHSRRHGLPVRNTANATARMCYVKVIWLTASILCMIALFSAGTAAHGEENTGERKIIARVEPEYPETLQRLYIGGVVRLRLTIAANGNVENVTLLGGNPILGQSAMAAVKTWKYAPASSRTTTEIKVPFDPHR